MAVISHDGNIKYNGIVHRVWSHQILIKIFTRMVMVIRWKNKCTKMPTNTVVCACAERRLLRMTESNCTITMAKMAFSREGGVASVGIKRSARLKELLIKPNIRPLAKCVK